MGRTREEKAPPRIPMLVFEDPRLGTSDAGRIAERLGVPFTRDAEETDDAELVLRMDETGLSLIGGGQVLRGDFTRLIPRISKENLPGELLVRAARIRGTEHPVAVDATAGLGEDAFLLAAAGFEVRMFEYDPVIAALLADALTRAAGHPALRDAAARMTLLEEDSVQALRALPFVPNVVLLDPMFPERRKSALVKKKFQLLHLLERPCGDEEGLLRAAFAAHPEKVIVKRPLKGPFLAGVRPGYSLSGKAIRYDCLIPPETPASRPQNGAEQ